MDLPLQSASDYTTQKKYCQSTDRTTDDIYWRVAKGLAECEEDSDKWEQLFFEAMKEGAIPAGRILSNVGASDREASTINCVVSGTIHDSMDGILSMVYESGLTLAQGCGIGYEFSTLRPEGAHVASAGASTCGPIGFMNIYDSSCRTVASAGGRRGAQMATFRVDHPDIIKMIKVKRQEGILRQFNISILITDEFMQAVREDTEIELIFPARGPDTGPFKYSNWPGSDPDYERDVLGRVKCQIYKKIRARDIWDLMGHSNYEFGDPGVIFIDRMNSLNNLWFCEDIRASNPCLTADAMIETRFGCIPIRSLTAEKIGDEDMEIVMDGDFWEAKPFFSQGVKPVFKVTVEGHTPIKATANHRFRNEEAEWIEVKDMKPGDMLETCDLKKGGVVPDWNSAPVVSVEPAGEEEVFDTTVPGPDAYISNGLVSHNCGEQPLPPYGACLLGSINLTKMVKEPFTSDASFDWAQLDRVVRTFTRMLDNVVEINGLPLDRQRQEIVRKRRHGMGITGLGSALVMMGIKYGSEEAQDLTREIMRRIAIAGWEVGIALAQEKGPAPVMDEPFIITAEMANYEPTLVDRVGEQVPGKELVALSKYMAKLPPEIRDGVRIHGSRFSHHTSVAPTGTISLGPANNVSNGVEPSFDLTNKRNIIVEGEKTKRSVEVFAYEVILYRHLFGDEDLENLPDSFVTADDVSPEGHVGMQAAAQEFCDSSISKTVNFPTDGTFDEFRQIYDLAYSRGLKGCALYRRNPDITSGVLVRNEDLASTYYKFTTDSGKEHVVRGDQEVEYDGAMHNAANLADAIKEKQYGNF